MTVEEAYKYISAQLRYASASFYGPSKGLSLGTGLIYSGIDYPSYSKSDNGFLTVEGKVWIITHECDVDQANKRPFNDSVLLCPIINFEDFVSSYLSSRNEASLKAFLSELAEHSLSRVTYIPMINDHLPFGGILDFNKITNTHISVFQEEKSDSICAFSQFGQGYIDKILTEHFFRAKAESLPQSWFSAGIARLFSRS